MQHPLVQLSRGLVLDASNNWNIVAFPYEKFFNFGESGAATLDWNRPVWVAEKTDGTLCTLYYHESKWCVATSGIPDAGGKLFVRTSSSEPLNWLDQQGRHAAH